MEKTPVTFFNIDFRVTESAGHSAVYVCTYTHLRAVLILVIMNNARRLHKTADEIDS